jgi:hypothetical protein
MPANEIENDIVEELWMLPRSGVRLWFFACWKRGGTYIK